MKTTKLYLAQKNVFRGQENISNNATLEMMKKTMYCEVLEWTF